MCGRITQRRGELPGLVTVEGYGDNRVKDPKDWVRFNGAPSQIFGSFANTLRRVRINATA